MTKTNSQIREEIEEEFIEILEYGKNLKGEEVWTDLEKVQWLRKKIEELLKSQREDLVEKIEKISDFADSGDTLKSRIINLIKERLT